MAAGERTLIVLGGARPSPAELALWAAEATHVIAADGGANNLAEAGCEPHTILGDLDSLDPALRARFRDANVLQDPDQDLTDFQKALRFSLDTLRASKVVVFGSEGDRLDHTLAALGAAAGRASEADIRFVFETSIAYLVAPSGSRSGSPGIVSLGTQPGAPVSIIPLMPSLIEAGEGLQWPVGGLELAIGVRDGVSNRATADRVGIAVASGCVAVFVGRYDGDIRW